MSDVSLVLTAAWTRCSRWRWWTWSPASCSPTSPGELWLADTEYSPLIGPQPAAGVHHHGPQPGARPAAPRGGGQQQRAERGNRPRGVHHQGGAATSRWVLRVFFSCLKGVWVILVHSLLMIQLKMMFSIVHSTHFTPSEISDVRQQKYDSFHTGVGQVQGWSWEWVSIQIGNAAT